MLVLMAANSALSMTVPSRLVPESLVMLGPPAKRHRLSGLARSHQVLDGALKGFDT